MIYRNMIAGSIARPDKHTAHAVHLVARAALHTPQLHMLHTEHGGRVYYLAVPSRDLASTPDVHTPLAAALPGHPDHKGDGAYLLHEGGIAVAVLCRGAALDLICNGSAAITDAVAAEGLPIYEVRGLAPRRLESITGRVREQGEKLAAAMRTITITWALAASLLAGGLMAYNAITDDGAARELKHIEQITRSVVLHQPLLESLATFQRVASVAVEAGGWFESYTVDKGKAVFTLRVPHWVEPARLEPLGATHRSLDKAHNQLVVTNKPPEK